MRLPPPVPELPVSDVRAAGESYARQMGFTVDWSYEDWLAGISRDDARVFLAAAEVDQLHAEWKERGALIVEHRRTA